MQINMQFINYFFASVLSFSGLFIGIILVKIAPEEQKPLEKYFQFARRTLLLMTIPFLFFYYSKNTLPILALTVFLAILFFVELRNYELLKKSMITYSIFGVWFFLSSKNINLFAVESSLIFLYGLPTASLVFDIKKKNHLKLIFCNLGFIIVLSILFFI